MRGMKYYINIKPFRFTSLGFIDSLRKRLSEYYAVIRNVPPAGLLVKYANGVGR